MNDYSMVMNTNNLQHFVFRDTLESWLWIDVDLNRKDELIDLINSL